MKRQCDICYSNKCQICLLQKLLSTLLRHTVQYIPCGQDHECIKLTGDLLLPSTPDNWKEANVSLIFENGDKSQLANNRPVSLTSICSKAIEHIIHSHLMNFYEDNQILCDQTHGFRKHRSCESQLFTTVQDLASGIDNSQQIDAILLDFSKAFDKVPHQRILIKLEHYGVRGTTLRWIRSFLSNKTQKVVVEGKSSCSAPVTSGVSQGTVLGLLLFLAYINDLPSNVNAKACLFADDCLLYRHIKTDKDAESLQENLNKLQDWETDWQMHFNPDKWELIRITNKCKIISATYQIHNIKLKQAKRAKNLGLTFSNTLSWNAHIDTITKKANNTTAFLRRKLSTCPKGSRGHLLQNICEASTGIRSHSMGSTHERIHQKGRSCPTEGD